MGIGGSRNFPIIHPSSGKMWISRDKMRKVFEIPGGSNPYFHQIFFKNVISEIPEERVRPPRPPLDPPVHGCTSFCNDRESNNT